MEITIELYFSAFQGLPEHLFDRIALGKQLLTGCWILSVQIMTRKAAPIVPNDDSIWIEHGHYLKNISFSEHFRSFFRTDQILDETLHNV